MFKKLVESLSNNLTKQSFDPSVLNDPLALQTEWGPAKSGGASFKTHQLKRVHGQRMEFRCSPGMFLFSGVFLALGIGAIIGTVFAFSNQDKQMDTAGYFLLPLFGLVFGGAGGWMLLSALTPPAFDLTYGYYCKSRKKPEQMMDPSQLKHYATLDQVHALQLISEYCRSSGKNKSSYYSYELNLVLKDGSRINIVDHGKLSAIKKDAHILSEFLGKPLWDATGAYGNISTGATSKEA